MSTDQSESRELGCSITKNVELLEELLDGPKRKGELADALGVTKQTIYNRFTQLQEFDLVERHGDGYGLTTVGRVVVEKQLRTLDGMDDILAAKSMVSKLPTDAVPPIDALESARTVVPEGHPEQVRREFRQWVLGADRVRAVFPYTSARFVEQLCETIQRERLTIDVALAPDSMTYLQECCPDAYCSVRDAESTVVVEASDPPAFGLVLVDEPRREAGLIGYTDDGYVCGLMRFQSEDGHHWADDQLKRHIDWPLPEATPGQVASD